MNESVEIQLSGTGSNLYFFFGGISAGIAIPPFEFYKSSGILDESKIFIRDFNQSWYQNGLPGISSNVYSTADFISQKICDIEPEKLYFVGNSMGGYAAILFSYLIGRGEAIAFSPQTFISPLLRLRYLDYRWTRQILNTYRKSLHNKKIWDLKSLALKRSTNCKISIFVSKYHRLDYIHASRLKDISGITVHEFNKGGHGVVGLLRDEGKLPGIMSGNYMCDS